MAEILRKLSQENSTSAISTPGKSAPGNSLQETIPEKSCMKNKPRKFTLGNLTPGNSTMTNSIPGKSTTENLTPENSPQGNS